MSKRPADIVISTPGSKVRRRLNFESPYTSRATVPYARISKKQSWANRPMYRKPRQYRLYRTLDVPRGCEGPCKVQSFDARHDVTHTGKVTCVSDVTRGMGLTHRVGKRFCIKSLLVQGKVWMDENIKTKNHTNHVMFFLVRDRRPYGTAMDFGQVFNMYDNEPSTATIKNDLRDRFQVLRTWYKTLSGGTYACKEQAIVKKFFRVFNHVVYNHQEAGKYENQTENSLLFYMACTHASNPVYCTLKIRIYFYDSVHN
ncbi:AV1 protein [Conyza yellow vein virus]|nr:AV1 protein [Conyza yellow vein virus]UED37340.1 AV1 protein [Conyza yellow vein virus]